jgi:hypothetical protein
MNRPSLPELIAQAGFAPGEFDKSRNLRGAVCSGIATTDQQAEYSQYAHKWDAYARLITQRDQAEAIEAAAPDPARHDADPDGGLGAAMAQHRAGKSPAMTVVRPRLIQVDVSGGRGAMMDIPEAQPLPMFRCSADSGGLQRIAAGLAAANKKP